MKRILMVIAMTALAFPGYSAPFGPGHTPGHNNNGGYGTPSQPGHGNGGGYGQPSQPGHGNGGGYGQPSQPGHDNGGGYGHPSQPGHGNGGGYGHPSQPGHGGGYGDHGQIELRQSFRRIQSLFSLVENSFFPGMTRRDMMECARNMNQIEREVSEVLRLVPMMAARDLEGVRYTVGQARFSLMTDFNAREAHQLVRRASMDFNMVSDRLIQR